MDGIVFLEGKIGYRFLPRVACTSLKNAIYSIEYDQPFDSANEDEAHIHAYYSKRQSNMDSCEKRIIVVRDPIKRFLSAYSGIVQARKELSYERIKKTEPEQVTEIQGFNPGLGRFIDELNQYQKIGSIHHHTKPITEFADVDIDYFNHVIQFEELNGFTKVVLDVTQKHFSIPAAIPEGRYYRVRDLSRQQMALLIDYYKKDYEWLNPYYSVEKIWREWKASY